MQSLDVGDMELCCEFPRKTQGGNHVVEGAVCPEPDIVNRPCQGQQIGGFGVEDSELVVQSPDVVPVHGRLSAEWSLVTGQDTVDHVARFTSLIGTLGVMSEEC